jgi:hypothetical protein
MAKVTAGILAGVISGKVGNVVFSHGRYGPYIRSRVIPTLVQNDYTSDVRNRLIALSQAWGAVAAADKDSWRTYAATHPVIDTLGKAMVLQPSAVFIGLNARILQAGGAQIDVPPIAAAPAAVAGQAVVADESDQTVTISWTSGALGATECLATRLAIFTGTTSTYCKNLFKLVEISAAAAETPEEVGVNAVLRFGAITEGQIVKCELEVWDNATGLKSTRSVCETAVVA